MAENPTEPVTYLKKEKEMLLILFGAPGVGKGTLAQRLQEEGLAKQVSTGDLFRREITLGTELGKIARQAIDAGKLVSDGLTLELVEGEIKGDIILDGYPRTLKQTEDLDKLLSEKGMKIDLVINVVADEEVVIDRIVNRLVCSKCHAIYNKKYAPPKVNGKCDKCGGDVMHRSDDDEQLIRTRFEEYHSKTRPLLAKYKQGNNVIEVDSSDLNAIEKIKQCLNRL